MCASAVAQVGKLQPEVGVRSLHFAADGKMLLSLGTNGSQLWDVRTGNLLRAYNQFPPRTAGELPLVAPFALSGDCKLAAFGSLDEPGLQLLEVATGKELRRLKGLATEEFVNVCMSFSADNRLLALGGVPGNIHLWETATGSELHRLRWHDMENSTLAFSADGKLLAAGSKHGRIGLWEVATGKQLRTLGRSESFETVSDLKFAGDVKVLASRTINGPFRLWNVATGKQIFELPRDEFIFDMVFAPSGKLLASWGAADNIIRIREVATLQERRLEGHSEMITTVAFSPDGKILASASRDRTLRFWDVETRKQRFARKLEYRTSDFPGAIQFLAWSPDGKVLASVPGPKNKIQLWDAATGEEIVK
jgi:WD40 repeat protein